jgi:tRNA A-37 threonylcarbamoyl transferase component Bud32
MKRVENLAGLDAAAIADLEAYLEKSPKQAAVTNPRKGQALFKATIQGRPLIVKQYSHRARHHRLASFCGQGNADRYCAIAQYLQRAGLPVPTPILVLKAGAGLLPERSLYVMESVDGDMLNQQLHELDADSERVAIVARKVADLMLQLREVGVIHRDLNTKNFLLSPENALHLIDFDHASFHRIRGKRFVRRHQRDIETFLSTCVDGPKLAAAVRSSLG